MVGLQVATVCLLVSLAAGLNPIDLFFNGPDAQVIGGQDADRGEWPFMVILEKGNGPNQPNSYSLTCGASLITETYLLCAAHCLFFFGNANEFRAKLGAHQMSANDEQAIIYAKTITRHPDFLFGLDEPDIAVIELESPADLTNQYIDLIPLPQEGQEFAGNENCYMTGWGRTDPNSQALSDIMQELNVPVHTTEECVQIFQDSDFPELAQYIHDGQICVAGPDDGSCHGDSGGSMHCDVDGTYIQAGITSWGTGDTCQGAASVYTKVASLLDWVRQNVPNLP